jgi:hypothetical protein
VRRKLKRWIKPNQKYAKVQRIKALEHLKAIGVNADLSLYLPIRTSKKWVLDEDWVLTVIKTLLTKWFKAVATAARDLRFTPENKDGKVEAIAINSTLWAALCARPFRSGKLTYSQSLHS